MSDQLTTEQRRANLSKSAAFVLGEQSYSEPELTSIQKSNTYSILSTITNPADKASLKASLEFLKQEMTLKVEEAINDYNANKDTISLLLAEVTNFDIETNVSNVNKILPIDKIYSDDFLSSTIQGLTSESLAIISGDLETIYRYTTAYKSQARLSAILEYYKTLMKNADVLIKTLDLIP